jgi:hypothetical protein
MIHRITIASMLALVRRWSRRPNGSAAREHQPDDQHQYCFHLSFPAIQSQCAVSRKVCKKSLTASGWDRYSPAIKTILARSETRGGRSGRTFSNR